MDIKTEKQIVESVAFIMDRLSDSWKPIDKILGAEYDEATDVLKKAFDRLMAVGVLEYEGEGVAIIINAESEMKFKFHGFGDPRSWTQFIDAIKGFKQTAIKKNFLGADEDPIPAISIKYLRAHETSDAKNFRANIDRLKTEDCSFEIALGTKDSGQDDFLAAFIAASEGILSKTGPVSNRSRFIFVGSPTFTFGSKNAIASDLLPKFSDKKAVAEWMQKLHEQLGKWSAVNDKLKELGYPKRGGYSTGKKRGDWIQVFVKRTLKN